MVGASDLIEKQSGGMLIF